MSDRDAWVQELKANGRVVVVYGYDSDPIKFGAIETVERTTKTQVILMSGSRFRRNTGILVGGRAGGARLVEATKDIMEARRVYKQHQTILARVHKVDLATLSLSQLSRIFDIIVEEQ